MFARILAALVVACALVGASASAQQTVAFAGQLDPRKLSVMPHSNELPSSTMSVAEVRARCLLLFDNTTYTMQAATERRGHHPDPVPFINTREGLFKTSGEMIADAKTGNLVCRVRHAWRWRSQWVSGGKADIEIWFNGKYAYTAFPAPLDKIGHLMVADGDGLVLTEYFYWDKNADGTPKPGASIHLTWGRYRPE